eukprot:CAMPEP_0172554722 /NCGR_PEP_ID=MMETSP1067-20121228/56194_1 /TAXON_ID=265564 ORGANISM="Thalassiosira punctigera, Strain Tpunct2005C2" /NCGR_SAMPLE_ID=MMETSP1067 /ASSEMBLY_ACC=CAM_ASM_000444 /LENGTH=929 /DNA_ID=CAMNT_0013343149 /DNA_START=43 /DNA_END=2832 /DNA_ORIENTATION=+
MKEHNEGMELLGEKEAVIVSDTNNYGHSNMPDEAMKNGSIAPSTSRQITMLPPSLTSSEDSPSAGVGSDHRKATSFRAANPNGCGGGHGEKLAPIATAAGNERMTSATSAVGSTNFEAIGNMASFAGGKIEAPLQLQALSEKSSSAGLGSDHENAASSDVVAPIAAPAGNERMNSATSAVESTNFVATGSMASSAGGKIEAPLQLQVLSEKFSSAGRGPDHENAASSGVANPTSCTDAVAPLAAAASNERRGSAGGSMGVEVKEVKNLEQSPPDAPSLATVTDGAFFKDCAHSGKQRQIQQKEGCVATLRDLPSFGVAAKTSGDEAPSDSYPGNVARGDDDTANIYSMPLITANPAHASLNPERPVAATGERPKLHSNFTHPRLVRKPRTVSRPSPSNAGKSMPEVTPTLKRSVYTMHSPLQEQKLQRNQEVQRLLQEVERLRKEAETLERLEAVQREAEELKRSLGTYQLAPEGNDSLFMREISALAYDDAERMQKKSPNLPLDSSDCGDFSSYGSEQSPRLQNYSDVASELSVPSPSMVIRPKISNTMKRRPPKNRQAELQVNDDTSANFDVERQSSKNRESLTSKPSLIRRAAASIFAVPARELLSKIIAAVFTDLDDETLQREDTELVLIVITLIKEAILGIVIAFAIVSFVLFLDHCLLLKLPTARNFRRAATALMRNEETLNNLEKSTGLNFLDMDHYNSMVGEIQKSRTRAETATNLLQMRSRELEEMEARRVKHKEESAKIFSSVGLDKFCETCIWSRSSRITCQERVEALQRTYHTPKITAMLSAMKKPSCRKKPSQEEEDNRKTEKEAHLVQYWSENKHDFCGDCQWEEKMTCTERAQYLFDRYSIPMERGKATALMETDKCKHSHYAELETKLKRFCPTCEWGPRLTCQQRVDFLMYTYKDNERMAKIDAIKRPKCLN